MSCQNVVEITVNTNWRDFRNVNHSLTCCLVWRGYKVINASHNIHHNIHKYNWIISVSFQTKSWIFSETWTTINHNSVCTRSCKNRWIFTHPWPCMRSYEMLFTPYLFYYHHANSPDCKKNDIEQTSIRYKSVGKMHNRDRSFTNS